jgi:hypothetical protein
MIVWQKSCRPEDFEELLELVEPFERERKAIFQCIRTNVCYNAYVARNKDNRVVALAIATLLPKTQTLHVEDFALHPCIRNRHYAQKLWDSWRKLVSETWTPVEAK